MNPGIELGSQNMMLFDQADFLSLVLEAIGLVTPCAQDFLLQIGRVAQISHLSERFHGLLVKIVVLPG